MAHDINFLDPDYGYIRIPLTRKIKFKGISFKNISSQWQKFRLNRLKSKLISKKEKLVEMEFSEREVSAGKNRTRTENKVMRKSKAIARLESKVNFLETGKYSTEEFINSRAIKLKNLMMNNLVNNRGLLYSVTAEAAQQIINDPSEVKKIIDEEQEKIGAKVREIMAEQETKHTAPISKEELAAAINNGFAKKQNDATVELGDVAKVVDHKMGNVSAQSTSNGNEIGKNKGEKQEKHKISSNGSSAAKVNKFINEDGTYRLKRDDIDEDFRITRINRKTTSPAESVTEPNIPPFNNATKREPIIVEDAKRSITAIDDRKKYNLPSVERPTIKEIHKSGQPTENADTTSTGQRDVPIVVEERQRTGEHRKPQDVTSIKHTSETSKKNTSSTLDTLMTRVSILEAEQNVITEEAKNTSDEAEVVGAELERQMGRLKEYADSLEKNCNEIYQATNEKRRKIVSQQAVINRIIELLENSGQYVDEAPVKAGPRR